MTRPTDAPAETGRLLPWRAVRALTGVSRTTIWRLRKAGDFPRPVEVSPGRVAWREDDIAAWKAGLRPRGEPGAGPLASTEPARPEASWTLRLQPAAQATPRRKIRPRKTPRATGTSPQMSFDF